MNVESMYATERKKTHNHPQGRPRLSCPACGLGRLIDTGQFIHSELHVMERGDKWEGDYYTKCPNPKCKADIGIRKIE
jgi:hypothetical protein